MCERLKKPGAKGAREAHAASKRGGVRRRRQSRVLLALRRHLSTSLSLEVAAAVGPRAWKVRMKSDGTWHR